ncbi:hypothetical protein [Kurthia massiliensis]|uniref:hypothetical protein n=1 Tax=Kurthia massiliensis TaxID=1033739 RepID=UPI0002891087|nr:hypothetical protein [Kurthia massiliensis]
MRLNSEDFVRFQKVIGEFATNDIEQIFIDAEIIYPAVYAKLTYISNGEVKTPVRDRAYYDVLEQLQKEIQKRTEKNEHDVFLLAVKDPNDGHWDVTFEKDFPPGRFGDIARLNRLEEKVVRIAKTHTHAHGVLYRELQHKDEKYLNGHHYFTNARGEREFYYDTVYNTPTEWVESTFTQILKQFHEQSVKCYGQEWTAINVIFHHDQHYAIEYVQEDLNASTYEERQQKWKERFIATTQR